MKLIKRGSKTSHSFKVVKNNFMWGGSKVEIGQELFFVGSEQMSEALGLCQRGCIVPTDMPPIADYICLRSFELPGKEKKHEAKVGELVELLASDALKLMLAGKVVPKDPDQWSPFRLKKQQRLSAQQEYLNELKESWRKE